MRSPLLFIVVPTPHAADHWVRYTAGPFENLTDSTEKTGQ